MTLFQSDYMALVIENGYPVLNLDFGSGPQRIVGNRYVSDGTWRQLIVDRFVNHTTDFSSHVFVHVIQVRVFFIIAH